MYFNLKRYYYGVIKRRHLFFLMIIIPCLYIGISAVIPDRFKIYQNIVLTDDTPVALLSNPVGYIPFDKFRAKQKDFFINSYTINKIKSELMPYWNGSLELAVNEAVRKDITILPSGRNLFRIEYYGKHRDIGELLVNYYSERLENIALEGKVRSNNNGGGSIKPELSGIIEITEIKTLWRSDRWIPLMISILASFAVVMMITAFLEWNDSSFKSERQIARYTGLPILGNVPDLNKVSKRIHTDTSIVS